MDDFYFSDEDDNVFVMKEVSKKRPAPEHVETVEPRNNWADVAEDVNNSAEDVSNSYDFMLAGNSKSSFPTMAVDYTFQHAPLDVCPSMMPTMTKKARERARQKREGDRDEAKLACVIDIWKSGNRRGSVRSSIIKKGSLRKKKDGDMMEENEIKMNSLALGSSDSSLKAINKWKTLRCKKT